MSTEPLRRLLGFVRRAADGSGPASDLQLLARFASHADADAFELLVWRHGAMVAGTCRRILGDAHAAEDACQATFLALARAAKSIRDNGSVAGWLHRVARRVAIRARSSEARRRDHERRFPPAAAIEPGMPNGDLRTVLDEELDRLPQRFRQPVVLCYLEGMSTSDAARQLGCPRGTVLSRLAAARAKLQARLVRRGVVPVTAGFTALAIANETSAAMIGRAVQAAMSGAATPHVIELCEGVLKAMTVTKIKIATALILTAGVIGGGAGWVAMSPSGPGSALADGLPQAKSAEKPGAAADDADRQKRFETEQRDRQARLLAQTMSELQKSMADLAENETSWSDQRVSARIKLVEAEEAYKKAELSRANEQTEDAIRLRAALENVADLRSKLRDMRLRLVNAENDQITRTLLKQVQEAEEDLARRQKTYDAGQAELSKTMLNAKVRVVSAEEQLSALDRKISMLRRMKESQVAVLQDRVNQLRSQEMFGRIAPIESKSNELDRRLDDILRELSELRREIRKP